MSFAAELLAPPPVPPGLPTGAVVASVSVASARAMDADTLADATRGAYHALRRKLADAGGTYMLRMWNYVPALLAPTGRRADQNRYMAFNVGRYAAMSEWFAGDLAPHAPAATGVGNPGDDLVIHALAAPCTGTAVQNPRQVAPTDYSARYGHRPPCFARATRVGRVLLVSGTAAITGEDSVAEDDLPSQLQITLAHLGRLAGGLDQYVSLRAYVPRAADAAFVADVLAERSPGVGRVTPIVADLCRPELLVEIEGVAEESGPA